MEAGWQAESLVMLLWALDRLDKPPEDRNWDASLFADRLPPSSGEAVEDFVAASRLRPARELAEMTDRLCRQSLERSEAMADGATSEQRLANRTSWERGLALHWIIHPDRPWD